MVLIADDIVISARLDTFQTKKAVLYGTPQPASSDFGCLTISYLGHGVHLQLYITKGTVYTRDEMVFERLDIDSKLFATKSIQTPTNTPYMVPFLFCFNLERSVLVYFIIDFDCYYINYFQKHLLQVILVGALKENRSGIIQIRKISYKEGICAGNSLFDFPNDIFEKKSMLAEIYKTYNQY